MLYQLIIFAILLKALPFRSSRYTSCSSYGSEAASDASDPDADFEVADMKDLDDPTSINGGSKKLVNKGRWSGDEVKVQRIVPFLSCPYLKNNII